MEKLSQNLIRYESKVFCLFLLPSLARPLRYYAYDALNDNC